MSHAEKTAANGNLAARANRTLLVIDDDEATLDELAEGFRSHDFRVYPATDAEEGARLARQLAPAFVIVDFQLPGADGHAAIAAMRGFHPTATYIMISGDRETACQRTSPSTAGKPYAILNKPVCIDRIAAFMRHKLESIER